MIAVARVATEVWHLLSYWLSGFVPRRSNLVVLGAWMGRRYADNSRFLLEYLARERPDLDLVWSGDPEVEAAVPDASNVRFVARRSMAARWVAARASACFVTHGPADIGDVPLLRGCKRVYLGHGIAMKRMGSPPDDSGGWLVERFRSVWRAPRAFDYWLASSPEHATKLERENQPLLIDRAEILPTGQPRLDPFFVDGELDRYRSSVRAVLRERYGIPDGAKLIAYLPTFRDSGPRSFGFGWLPNEDAEALQLVLGRADAWIVEKAHAADTSHASDAENAARRRCVDVGQDVGIDTQELLISADLLITDYSGCYFDFLELDRPIVHFAYDYSWYVNRDRGLYFDLDDMAGGDVVSDFDSLLDAIERNLADSSKNSDQRRKLRERILTWETGTACETTARRVLGD